MSGLKKIRSRIVSVKNTEQITQAMKMVATARLKKAEERILNLRPYAENILSVMADVALSCKVHHPLLKKKDSLKKVLLVVLTSDRGLCGGLTIISVVLQKNFITSIKNMRWIFFS